MKIIVFISFCLVLAAVLTEAKGPGRRPRPRPSRPPLHIGWRHVNGSCICRGPNPMGHNRPTGSHGPMGHHGHHHGTGPRPTGHHGPRPTGHHGPRPTGHHGHHGPRPTGHHGHHGPRPTGHHGHHGPRPSGHHGHHGHRPSHAPFSSCNCQKSERTVHIMMRMKKKFSNDLLDCKSRAYRRMSLYILKKLKQVLKMANRFTKMKFSHGSVIVEVGAVYDVSQKKEDPEKALREAIKSGDMKDMGIYPESLNVHDSYSGVALSGWTASESECRRCKHHDRHHRRRHHHGHHKEDKKHDDDDDEKKHGHEKDERKHDDGEHHEHMVFQTRTCTEIDASCDGIPLSRNASCDEACPRMFICWGGWARRHKYVVISCVAAVLILVIVIIVTLVRVKKSRKKYIKTSPSSSSIKELAKNDELEEQQAEPLPSKC